MGPRTGREAIAGTLFGDHWRRNQDDYNGYGTWSLNWIEENHETFLEADDEVDTNSIAIELDTYGNRFGPDDW